MKLKALLIFSFIVYAIAASAFITAPITRAPINNSAQPDSSVKSESENANLNTMNPGDKLGIDTSLNNKQPETIVPPVIDTAKKPDTALVIPVSENTLTNTKLFIYITLSVLGLGLFFFIFVINLFKTFHRKKSTRQSLLLSWNLFFIVSIIWLFIIWGLLAGFWTSASFMVV
nr:hypothetical protein [Ignavibacteria bacterium]